MRSPIASDDDLTSEEMIHVVAWKLRHHMERETDVTVIEIEALAAQYGALSSELAHLLADTLEDVRLMPLRREEAFKDRAEHILGLKKPVSEDDIVEGEFSESDISDSSSEGE